MRIVTQVIINRPPAEVWRYLVNPSNLRKWLKDFVRYEPLCGCAGRPGSVALHHYAGNKRQLVLEETILDREEHRYLLTSLTHTTMHSQVATELRDLGDGRTEVTCTVHTRFTSTLTSWVMSRFLQRNFQHRQDEDFDRLRDVVEEEVAPAEEPLLVMAGR
jgi:uncharacterized protein YndB with AHSA1/START domain